MEVPSLVTSGDKQTLICEKEPDSVNDTFVSLQWFKLVDHKWQLFKIIGQTQEGETGGEAGKTEGPVTNPATDAPQTGEGNTEGPQPDTTVAPAAQEDKPAQSAPTKQIDLYKWSDLSQEQPEEGTPQEAVVIIPNTMESSGAYKCLVKSKRNDRSFETEMIKEMRVIFRPQVDEQPVLDDIRVRDSHVWVRCRAPASHPKMVLTFFVNAEQAPHEDVHYLEPIRVTNASYGINQTLWSTVEELRVKTTQDMVLNNNLQVFCAATLANYYNGSALVDIPYDGPIYGDNHLSASMIVLVIVIVVVVIVIIAAIVWVIMRKKKINALNKVSELFNKQKTITVLVDNPKDE